MLLLKLSIDMAIQSEDLSVHALTSQLYIIMHTHKAPIYKISRSKAPKTQQICCYRHARKINGPFSLHDTGVYFGLRNNFANLRSFAKTSVPVESIIPWLVQST